MISDNMKGPKRICNVINLDGKMEQLEILASFEILSTGCNYIVLTENEKYGNNKVMLYVSRVLEDSPDNFKLVGIQDKDEWIQVKQALSEIITGDDYHIGNSSSPSYKNSPTAVWSEIEYVLKNSKITTIEDIEKLKTTDTRFIDSHHYPWVMELGKLVSLQFDYIEDLINTKDGQFIMIDNISTADIDDISKYICLFPERAILSTDSLIYLDDNNPSYVDTNFLKKLLWMKPLLDQGLLHISTYSRMSSAVDPGCLYEDVNMLLRNKKIPVVGKIHNKSINTKLLNRINVSMPWLAGASIYDFIELVKRNPNQYLRYNNYIAKIMRSSNDLSLVTEQFIDDFESSTSEILISMQKKQSELRRKGITTIISFFLTLLPYVISEYIDVLDPKICSTFLGGSTVKDILHFSSDVSNLRDIGIDNYFWLLWKWQKASKKKMLRKR